MYTMIDYYECTPHVGRHFGRKKLYFNDLNMPLNFLKKSTDWIFPVIYRNFDVPQIGAISTKFPFTNREEVV